MHTIDILSFECKEMFSNSKYNNFISTYFPYIDYILLWQCVAKKIYS